MKTNSLRHIRNLGLAALAVATLLVPARAIPAISLTPVAQNIAVGGTAFVNLNISGLGAGVAPSLGSWLVNISFNSAIVSIGAGGVTFGTNLDLGVFGSLQGVDTTTAGLLKLDEVSFEDTAALNAAQPAAFTLATLSFVGLTPGTTQLMFTRVELGNELGFPMIYDRSNASITVLGTTGVPDGGSTTLAATACVAFLCIVHARRRRLSA